MDVCRFSPGDEMFVSASEDGRVNVFDHGLAKKEVEVRRHGAEIRCCDWHPTMSLIALGGKDHLIEVWDPMSKNLVGSLYAKNQSLTVVIFFFF
jgi:polyadenylation factor subunit 2